MADRVEIDILAKVDSAVAGLESFIKKIALTYVSYEGLKKLVESSFKAFSEVEVASTRLATAISSMGAGSSSMTESLIKYSEELEKTSGFGDELLINLTAQGVSFGLNKKQIEETTLAATKLANAGIMGLDQAFTQLALTYDGQSPRLRVLKNLIGDLTEAQLTNGDAVTTIIGKLGDINSAMMETAQGGVTALKNAFENLLESVGNLITSMGNPAIKVLTNIIDKTSALLQTSINLKNAYTAWNAGQATASQNQLVYNDLLATANVNLKAYTEKNRELRGSGVSTLDKRYIDNANQIKTWEQRIEIIKNDIKASKELEEEQEKLYNAQADALQAAADAAAEYAAMLAALTTSGNENNEFLSKRIRLLSALNVSQPSWVGEQVYTAATGAPTTNAYGGYGPDMSGLNIPESTKVDTADLSKQYEDIADSAVKIAGAMGEAFATGDFSSAIQMMISELGRLIISEALAAGLRALISPVPNYPLAASMFALAGFTAFGMGALNSGGSAAYSGPSNQYSSVATGRSVTVNVAGSVWTSGDLAREVAAVQQGW